MSESGRLAWLQGIIRHARKHPFVFVAMLTAFPYTAWCAANVLHGLAPHDEGSLALYWVTAIMFATTIDIGAVSVSARLSEKWALVDFLAFLFLVGGMWYVQTLYALIHYAPLVLSASIPEYMRATAQTLVDFAVWILPIFIPVPLVINALRGLRLNFWNWFRRPTTVSDSTALVTVQQPIAVRVETPVQQALPEQTQATTGSTSGGHTGEAVGHIQYDGEWYNYTCPKCGKTGYKATREKAQAALNVHMGRYCPKKEAANTVEVVEKRVDSE